jgi:hypothetical protein
VTRCNPAAALWHHASPQHMTLLRRSGRTLCWPCYPGASADAGRSHSPAQCTCWPRHQAPGGHRHPTWRHIRHRLCLQPLAAAAAAASSVPSATWQTSFDVVTSAGAAPTSTPSNAVGLAAKPSARFPSVHGRRAWGLAAGKLSHTCDT